MNILPMWKNQWKCTYSDYFFRLFNPFLPIYVVIFTSFTTIYQKFTVPNWTNHVLYTNFYHCAINRFYSFLEKTVKLWSLVIYSRKFFITMATVRCWQSFIWLGFTLLVHFCSKTKKFHFAIFFIIFANF